MAENILNRGFHPDKLTEKWLIDTTEFKYTNGNEMCTTPFLHIEGFRVTMLRMA
ncbi:MAG: hypothetical protein E6600_17900 [Anaerocolumna aminovalerica]|uniref:hypothetical protein n=1 Tax=Anaerocolumna aminovalerica TaxID=1527 RepID=UPI001C0F2F4B|nr:hypothetical protein [Anaerocolumna aminovalerica]MBU5333478.1 hypothetical protein [Anaerocolumna aminovalerica]MDU6266370.1 hypothetical protein [Anaerocolumna aminovalerica]